MTQLPKPQISTIENQTVTRIVPELATEVGLNESIVLMQISFWIGTCNNIRDGDYWTYQSAAKMREEAFPYWSEKTINRAINSLKKQGLIKIGFYNRRKQDNTRWFALNVEAIDKLTSVGLAYVVDGKILPTPPPYGQNVHVEPDKMSTSIWTKCPLPYGQNAPTLPEITTETTQKDSSDAGASGTRSATKSKKPTAKESTPEESTDIDPMFEAVSEHVFGLCREERENAMGGRIAPISNWLKGKIDRQKNREPVGFISRPAEPQHVIQFVGHYKNVNPGASVPRDLTKFVEHWREWASRLNAKKQRIIKMTQPEDESKYITPEQMDAIREKAGQEQKAS